MGHRTTKCQGARLMWCFVDLRCTGKVFSSTPKDEAPRHEREIKVSKETGCLETVLVSQLRMNRKLQRQDLEPNLRGSGGTPLPHVVSPCGCVGMLSSLSLRR